jgi:hypothetical protein
MEFNGNTTKPFLRIIGDVHGKMEDYLVLADAAEYSVQVGDMGFEYHALTRFLEPDKHKVLGGNHDNYEKVDGKFIFQTPHFLGDYGVHTIPGCCDFFFVRGGKSIDWKQRLEWEAAGEGRSWWSDEELSYGEGMKALEMYKEVKPEFVITHECPASLVELVSGAKTWDGVLLRPSLTANLLEAMWDAHQPKLWLFGHHHRDFFMNLRGTDFRCLKELGYVDLNRKEDK